MKISTEISSLSRIIGEERAVEMLAKVGFDAWDFSMFRMVDYSWETRQYTESDHPLAGADYLAFARRLRRIGEDNGIHCNQSHAPFPSSPVCMKYLFRAIECTAEAGGDICVIHPDTGKTVEGNAEMYGELLPFAKSCGVKIATENMWGWNREEDHAAPVSCSIPESFNAQLDAINDPYFVACLDIGHAEMKGLGTTAREMILGLGDRLAALHIHDNDRWHDTHQIPFSMEIDFDAVVAALKEIRYGGYFTLEADAFLKAYTEENAYEGALKLAKSAKRLADMFEK